MILAGAIVTICLLAVLTLAWWLGTQRAEPVVIVLTKTKKSASLKVRLDRDDRPVVACPNCGRTGGREGPFRSPKAVHGHMRRCPGKPQENLPGSAGA